MLETQLLVVGLAYEVVPDRLEARPRHIAIDINQGY